MEIIKRLDREKINIEVANVLLLKVQGLFLSVHFYNTNPFIHFLFCHFIVSFPSHYLFLLFRKSVNFLIFVIHDCFDEARQLML